MTSALSVTPHITIDAHAVPVLDGYKILFVRMCTTLEQTPTANPRPISIKLRI